MLVLEHETVSKAQMPSLCTLLNQIPHFFISPAPEGHAGTFPDFTKCKAQKPDFCTLQNQSPHIFISPAAAGEAGTFQLHFPASLASNSRIFLLSRRCRRSRITIRTVSARTMIAPPSSAQLPGRSP